MPGFWFAQKKHLLKYQSSKIYCVNKIIFRLWRWDTCTEGRQISIFKIRTERAEYSREKTMSRLSLFAAAVLTLTSSFTGEQDWVSASENILEPYTHHAGAFM